MDSTTQGVAPDPCEVSVLLIGSAPEVVFSGSHQGYVAKADTEALAFGEPCWPGKAGMVMGEAIPGITMPNRSETAMAAVPSESPTAELSRSFRRLMIAGSPCLVGVDFDLRPDRCDRFGSADLRSQRPHVVGLSAVGSLRLSRRSVPNPLSRYRR